MEDDSKPTPVRPEPVAGLSSSSDNKSSASTSPAPTEKGKPKSGWSNILVDYGPILVFFLTYRYFAPEGENIAGQVVAVVNSTGAFIAAAIVALLYSKFKLGRVSPMLWISTGLIAGFGGLTIFFADEFWIQIKPTVIYLFFGTALLIAWLRGKALLQWALEAAFEGLSDEGWLKLSRNWAVFFFALAALNEALRFFLSFEDWLAAKLWVFLPLSFLFTFAQLPMLLKHGLAVEAEAEEETTLPPA
jgi:intracellular septation protein